MKQGTRVFDTRSSPSETFCPKQKTNVEENGGTSLCLGTPTALVGGVRVEREGPFTEEERRVRLVKYIYLRKRKSSSHVNNLEKTNVYCLKLLSSVFVYFSDLIFREPHRPLYFTVLTSTRSSSLILSPDFSRLLQVGRGEFN